MSKMELNITPRAQTLMELLAEEFERSGYGDCYVVPSFEHGAPTSIFIRRDDDYAFGALVDDEWTQGVSVDD